MPYVVVVPLDNVAVPVFVPGSECDARLSAEPCRARRERRVRTVMICPRGAKGSRVRTAVAGTPAVRPEPVRSPFRR